MPKSTPVAETVVDFRGEVKDGLLFLSFIMPSRTVAATKTPEGKKGTEPQPWVGFRFLKNCPGCGGSLELWKEIRLTDTSGYTIYKGRFYTYDNDLTPGQDYTYRVIPFTEAGVQGAGSNTFLIKWQRTPKPPKDVTAKAGEGSIELSWTKEEGISYNIYRVSDNVYPLEPVNPALITTGSFTDYGLENGKRYKYEVRSVRVEGVTRWEGEGTTVEATTVDRTPPAVPSGLVGTKKDNGVLLSWTANAEKDLLGYNVFRSAAGKTEKLNKEPLAEPSFFDAAPGAARYVSYYVTAIDKSGNESGPSREIIVVLKE
jgi:fibronectin type 3 domain-containing protein